MWEKIISNKDLHLPTQQQLLAQFRCDEIMKVVSEVFNNDCQALNSLLRGGAVDDFRDRVSGLFNKCIGTNSFDILIILFL